MVAAQTLDNLSYENTRPYLSSLIAKPHRILIDSRKLYDGGVGTYLQNLIEGLIATENSDITLLINPDTKIPTSWLQHLAVTETNIKPHSVSEITSLARDIDQRNFDLFHTPYYVLPLGLKIPSIITVHDLIHILYPDRWSHRIVAPSLMRSSISRASKVIAVSEATKKDLEKFLHNDSKLVNKIRIVPNSLDPFFTNGEPANSTVKRNYLVGVFSNTKPHKGLKELISAFRAVKESSPHLSLVLVGSGAEVLLRKDDTTLSRDGILALGHVRKEELKDVYRGALALVVSSTIEGFCLPVMEAHAVGTPVVTRPIPAVLEQVTHSDIVCKDFSRSALIEALTLMAKRVGNGRLSLEERESLKQKFSREKVRDALISVYKEVHQNYQIQNENRSRA